MTPSETVTEFISAIERKDLPHTLTLVDADIEYDNVPLGAVRGIDDVRNTLEPFLATCDEIDWQVRHQVAQGNVVMNERVDRFRLGDRWLELPVAGLFVVGDGRITLWRDYFDVETFRTLFGR